MANHVVLGAPGAVAPCTLSAPGGSSVAFRHTASVRQRCSLYCNSRYVTKCCSSGPGDAAQVGSYGNPATPGLHYPGAQGPYTPPSGSGTGYGGGGSPGGYSRSSSATGYSSNANYPVGAGGNIPRYMSDPPSPNASADFGWRKGMHETTGAAPSGPYSPATPPGYVPPSSAQGGGGYNVQGSAYPSPGTGGGGTQTYGVTGNPPNANSPGGFGTPAPSSSTGFGAPAGYGPPPPGGAAGPGYGRAPSPHPPPPQQGSNYAGTGVRSSYNAPRSQASYTPRGSPAAKSPPKAPMPEFKLPDGTNKWTSVDEMRRHYFPNAENEPPPKRTYKTPDPGAGGFVIPDGSRKWNSIDEMRRHYFPNEDFSQPPKRTYKAPDPKAGGFVLPDGSRKWNSIDEMRRHYFPNEDFSKPPKPFGSSNKAGGDKV